MSTTTTTLLGRVADPDGCGAWGYDRDDRDAADEIRDLVSREWPTAEED